MYPNRVLGYLDCVLKCFYRIFWAHSIVDFGEPEDPWKSSRELFLLCLILRALRCVMRQLYSSANRRVIKIPVQMKNCGFGYEGIGRRGRKTADRGTKLFSQ